MQTLKDHIKDLDISQNAFAARLGVSKGYLSQILNGQRSPSRAMILRIDRATDGTVPPAVWFETSGDAA